MPQTVFGAKDYAAAVVASRANACAEAVLS